MYETKIEHKIQKQILKYYIQIGSILPHKMIYNGRPVFYYAALH